MDEEISENPFAVIEPSMGQAECYWCGGIRKVEAMKKIQTRGGVGWTCKECA